jgi:probable F420-dependent oxidoreductase
MIKVGVLLSQVNHHLYSEVTVAAEELGFESVWLGDHVVLPKDLRGDLVSEDAHPPIDPTAAVLDVCDVLSFLAGRTARIRLGTFVYLLGLRHPFQSARAFATLDLLSQGRVEMGIGAGWARAEWEATGSDFDSRGRCLDEALTVCRRLWTETWVEHRGEFFDFPPVAFEPKPVQVPLPVSIGGESRAAFRRAARGGQGWMGMEHTPETAAAQIQVLRHLEREVGRSESPVEVTVVGELDEVQSPHAWASAGVDRLIVHPWKRSSEAVDSLSSLSSEFLS